MVSKKERQDKNCSLFFLLSRYQLIKMSKKGNRKLKRKLFIKTANKTKKINTPLGKNYRGGIRL